MGVITIERLTPYEKSVLFIALDVGAENSERLKDENMYETIKSIRRKLELLLAE